MTRKLEDVIIEKNALGRMTELARGGQARVFKLESPPPFLDVTSEYVYKRYHQDILNESGQSLANDMPELILFPRTMTSNEQRFIRRHTVWPQGLVVDNGVAEGVVMKMIPDPFFFDLKYGADIPSDKVLLEMQFLIVPESKKKERGIPSATAEERIYLLLDILKIVEFLHRKGIIIGDFSPKNLIVSNPMKGIASAKRKFTPKILDVDTFRFEGHVPPLKQMHTPNWVPPEAKEAILLLKKLELEGASPFEISRARAKASIQTTKTDIFKVGLLTLRLFHVPPNPNEDDTQSICRSEKATERINRLVGSKRANLLLSMLDVDSNNRPSASEVLKAFSN